MDVTDKDIVREGFENCSPDIVYHCAAVTNVDACEADPSLANEVNVEGTRYIVHEAKRVGCQVIYISTDYVFDGQQGSTVRRTRRTRSTSTGGPSLRHRARRAGLRQALRDSEDERHLRGDPVQRQAELSALGD
jgi:nucleoside-diphosphate-sugar epimerase